MRLIEIILNNLISGKELISIKYSQIKLPIEIEAKRLPQIEKFSKSKIFAKKIIHLTVGNVTFHIIDGYITYKRYIEVKEIKKRNSILFFKHKTKYITDEDAILSIIKKYKCIAKKDFDEKKNVPFYYIWMPAYAITDLEKYEEINHNEYKQIQRKFNHYKLKIKRKLIESKTLKFKETKL